MQEQHPPVQPEKPQHLAVIRKGMKVFVGEPKGVGLWITTSSAPLARAAEAGLKARLKAGWPGTLPELLKDVEREVNGARLAHESVRRCIQRIADARDAVTEARARLEQAELDLAESERKLERAREVQSKLVRH